MKKKTLTLLSSLALASTLLVGCGKVKQYEVNFEVDGNIVDTIIVNKGSLVVAPENNPTKESTAQYSYEFDYWAVDGVEFDFENTTITANLTLSAVFESTVRSYVATFIDGGQTYATSTLEYNSVVTAPENNPTKDDNDGYSYEFLGWSKDGTTVLENLGNLVEDTSYYSVYSETVNTYTITLTLDWLTNDNVVVIEFTRNNKDAIYDVFLEQLANAPAFFEYQTNIVLPEALSYQNYEITIYQVEKPLAVDIIEPVALALIDDDSATTVEINDYLTVEFKNVYADADGDNLALKLRSNGYIRSKNCTNKVVSVETKANAKYFVGVGWDYDDEYVTRQNEGATYTTPCGGDRFNVYMSDELDNIIFTKLTANLAKGPGHVENKDFTVAENGFTAEGGIEAAGLMVLKGAGEGSSVHEYAISEGILDLCGDNTKTDHTFASTRTTIATKYAYHNFELTVKMVGYGMANFRPWMVLGDSYHGDRPTECKGLNDTNFTAGTLLEVGGGGKIVRANLNYMANTAVALDSTTFHEFKFQVINGVLSVAVDGGELEVVNNVTVGTGHICFIQNGKIAIKISSFSVKSLDSIK